MHITLKHQLYNFYTYTTFFWRGGGLQLFSNKKQDLLLANVSKIQNLASKAAPQYLQNVTLVHLYNFHYK